MWFVVDTEGKRLISTLIDGCSVCSFESQKKNSEKRKTRAIIYGWQAKVLSVESCSSEYDHW